MAEKIKNFLDRGWVRWFLAILTVFGVGWAVFEHFHVRNPRIEFEIVYEARLFNNSERVSSIRLYIDSLDVREQNLNVSLYSIKVSNNGRKHLSSSDYEGGRFGLMINDGRLLGETQLTGSSNNYIKDVFQQEENPRQDDSFLSLPIVALDINDYYEFSIAILHEDSVSPTMTPVGKILGQKVISISHVSSKEKQSLWSQVFHGSMWAHVIRIILGFVVFFVLAVFLTGLIESIGELKEKKNSNNLWNEIEVNNSIPEFLKNDVKNSGLDSIVFLGKRLDRGAIQMRSEYRVALSFVSKVENLKSLSFEKYRQCVIGYQGLIDKGYLTIDSNGVLEIPDKTKEAVSLVYERMQQFGLQPHTFRRSIQKSERT